MQQQSPIEINQGSVQADVLSGLTVALALVPEAVAFAFVAGVSPIVGLYGAFMMGFITAVFGGRPGMISGATGAMAVVMVSLVAQGNAMGDGLGVQFLFATLLLTGLIQVLAGVFRLGKFVRMIPSPVMMGFVNGLAIVIGLSQLGMFKKNGAWLAGDALWIMVGLTALTMAIIAVLPKLTKQVPAALVGIATVSLLVIFGGIQTETVLSFIQGGGGEGLAAGLPSFQVPLISFSVENLLFMLPYACILAAIGLIESLMTLNLIDDMTKTRGQANRECMAQGAGNLVNGLFGGMGGCAMIGQSIINIKSGGRGRLSGIVASVALLLCILFASPIIEKIPIAALVGVMFMVVIGTFAWNTFKILNKVPASDVLVMLVVTGVTVAFDLAIAVACGIVVSALVFAWENAKHIRARTVWSDEGVKVYEVLGPLFFASTTDFLTLFDIDNDPEKVVIDFEESRIMDQSAIEAINKLTGDYARAGKTLQLRHLSRDCVRLIKRAEKICSVNMMEDPEYFVAVDEYNQALSTALGEKVKISEEKMEAFAKIKAPRKNREEQAKRKRRDTAIGRKSWRQALRKNAS